jgi:hypothetical protein
MRLDEFYNPEDDNVDSRQVDDTRKPVLTLEQLNKLRKIREIKKAEAIEHEKFVRVMYAQAAQEQM